MIYNRIFRNLAEIIELEETKKLEFYQKFRSPGLMDFNVETIGVNGETVTLALSHYYEQNGDLMADPDMEVRVNLKYKTAEALTYQQDGLGIYQSVYFNNGEKTLVNNKLKVQLNRFLLEWLKNIKRQEYERA